MDKISLFINSVVGILLAVYIILWIIEKTQKIKGGPTPTTIYIDVSNQRVKTIYEETKEVDTTAELVAEFTRSIDTITQDRKKNVSFEISNGPGNGYTIKTKFGSS